MAACAAFLAFGTPAGAASFEMDKQLGKTRGWDIGVSYAMRGCMASATYEDQTTVYMGFGGSREKAFFVLSNPKWRSLESGTKYEIRMVARGQGRWRGTFTGINVQDNRGLMAQNLKDGFVIDIAKAGGLDVVYDKKVIAQLSLAGSMAAIDAVLDCQKDHLVAALRDSPEPPPEPAAGSGRSSASAREDKRDKDDGAGSSGTGFAVSEKGHLLTNHHVIDGCKKITATRVGEPAVPVSIVASDARNDLALLKANITPSATEVPALNIRARVGDNAYVYGFPLSGILTSNGNFTAGNVTAAAGLADDSRMLQVSAPVQPGNSGGPLLDQNANIVGVVVSKLNALKLASVTNDVAQNVNFAIKSTIAVNFLETNGIEAKVQAGPGEGEKLDPASVAEKAKTFTYRIECK
ncbi:S1C family serine protease [Xanthobacteraceae bacterium A53D]